MARSNVPGASQTPRPASDLTEFVAVLLRLVNLVLDGTINGACVAVLVVALLLPWRLLAVLLAAWLDGPFRPREQAHFRRYCVAHLGASLLDVVAVPILLLCLLWPPRWPLLACSWQDAKRNDDFDSLCSYNTLLRLTWIWTFFRCCRDVLGVLLGLLALVLPWRTASLLRRGYSTFEGSSRAHYLAALSALAIPLRVEEGVLRTNRKEEAESYDALLTSLAWIGMEEGSGALLDAPLVAWALPSVVVPTRTLVVLRLSLAPRSEENPPCAMRRFWAWAPLLAAADALAGLVSLVMLLNPLRADAFVGYVRMRLGAESGASHTAWPPKSWSWRPWLRTACFDFALLALLDLLVLPLALVLVSIGLHRSGPVFRQLSQQQQQAGRGASSIWDLPDFPSEWHGVVLRQFELLCLDLLVLPCVLLVLMTAYRWPWLKDAWVAETDDEYDEDELHQWVGGFHLSAAWNALLVLHDLIQLPFVLLLVLSMYRAPVTLKLISDREDNFREDLWEQLGQLLLDFLHLPGLLVLLATLWRADLVLRDLGATQGDAERRRMVLGHLWKLLRDMFGMAAALIVACSLVRLPSLALDLWARHKRSMRPAYTGPPRLRPTSVRLLVPTAEAEDRRPRLSVLASQDSALEPETFGQLTFNASSADFWRDVARVFGGALASLGQGLLPLALKDGKHLKYEDFLPQDVSFEMRLGNASLLHERLPKLNHSLAICFDIERQPAVAAAEPELLLRLALPLAWLELAASQPGQEVELPQELVRSEPDVVVRLCGGPEDDLSQGSGGRVGLRDFMWLSALSQLIQLCIDLAHFVLLLVVLLAPWQVVSLLRHLREPESYWLAELGVRASSLATRRWASLLCYRRSLEPALHAAAKKVPVTRKWKRDAGQGQCHTKLEAAVLARLKDQVLPPETLERWLLKEMRHGDLAATKSLAERLTALAAIQDAAATFWPSLAFAAHLQLLTGSMEVEEHAHALCLIQAIGSQADGLAEDSLRAICHDTTQVARSAQDSAAEKRAGIARGLMVGLLGKPLELQRKLVYQAAASAAIDWMSAGLLVLLLVTGYRLPAAVLEMRHHHHDARLADRLRMAVSHQAMLLSLDSWHLVTALAASLLAIITLVRALDFISEAALHVTSLLELRALGLRCAKEAVSEVWELLSLFTFWRTYRCAVRASVFGVLLPASGLAGLPPKAQLLLWSVLCAFPWLLPLLCGFQPSVALGLACAAMLPCFIILCRSGAGRGEQSVGYGVWVRLSWPNLLALLAIVGEAALLAAVPEIARHFEPDRLILPAVCASCSWLLISSLPPSLPSQEQADCQTSVRFHACCHVFRHCLLLPVASVLFAAVAQGSCWLALLLLFLIATSVLGIKQFDTAPPLALGLDLAPPPLYMSGLALSQLLLLQLELTTAPGLLQLAASLLAPFWALGYPHLFGQLGGVPPWLQAVRGVAALLPALAQIRRQLPSWAALAALVMLMVLAAVLARAAWKKGLDWRRREAAASNVAELMQHLVQKDVLLHAPGGQSVRSALLSAAHEVEAARVR
ncbi:unnamed protein product, partial [Polarella glacialis]